MDGLVTIEAENRLTEATPATPADIVLYAMKSGADVATIRELMALQREYQADESRKAFVADMAQFKRSAPEVVKDKKVGYTNKDGTFTGYIHASLGNVVSVIVPALGAHGFSHRWDIDQSGQNITVVCVLTHKMGHCERTTMTAQKDDSGKKNQIQQVASTISYLERYTLLAATGVATKDQEDDDGAGSGAGSGEGPESKGKTPAPKFTINGVRFAKGIDKILSGEYKAEDMRKNFELTTDQEISLQDAEKEIEK